MSSGFEHVVLADKSILELAALWGPVEILVDNCVKCVDARKLHTFVSDIALRI